MDFETIWIVLASDFCQLEDLEQLGPRQGVDELTGSCLLAVATFTPPRLPLCNTALAVDRTLAERANDRYFRLWHDHFLADDAEGVGEETKAVKFLLVADSVLRYEVRRPQRVHRCLLKGEELVALVGRCGSPFHLF